MDEWPGSWLENGPATFVRELRGSMYSMLRRAQLLVRARAHGSLLNSSGSRSTPSLISSPCLPADTHTELYSYGMSRNIAGYGPQSAQYSSRPFRGPPGEPQVTRCFRLGWPLHLSSRGRYLRPASLATGRPWFCRHPHPGARCSDSTIGLRFIDLDEFFCAASIAPVHVSYGL
ncbi:hypothetical protein HDV57DRAFT_347181 [Trichoderma longibrachiatum]|uniref:Uncharacterized protein n=1 Tax=Trichoderma longibrachiatum ATCC 18648 TaxID=983965 RepID=A0A2T4BXW4_TRILO|nr:hypothetical protein M440DRAFT_109334 [Trichoderma longibrachiatum ATCC 18648]